MNNKNNKYLQWWATRDCIDDVMPVFDCNHPAKELTESISSWKMASRLANPQNPNVLVLCVGDGVMPRTAALIAHVTRWTCVSADPIMRVEKAKEVCKDMKRLYIYESKERGLHVHLHRDTLTDRLWDAVIIIHTHSHARLSKSVMAAACVPTLALHAISLPCCVEDDLPLIHRIKKDKHILSPKNTWHIYKDIYTQVERLHIITRRRLSWNYRNTNSTPNDLSCPSASTSLTSSSD